MDSAKVKNISTPVLVIGAGAAGARAAIEMAKNDVKPLVVSKRDHGDAHTTWARGGINASLGNLDPEDSWEIHAADTIDEGHSINNPTAVEMVTKNMPEVIRELEEWGMEFSRTEDGKINQRYFGAQSFRRTCFAGDYTGEALLDTLVDKAQSLDIPYMDNVYISKILSDGEQAYGAVGYDMESGEFLVFRSDKVVLAAGGHTAVYSRHSSRDDENTGDGVGLAYDAGAELMDMEFVQFHPTGMVGDRYGEEWDGRLVTEAVRGEGGRLFNSEGERFMKEYSPDQMELDARDVVARAIVSEIEEGRGTENGGVYLDISHRDEEFIKDRLPRMYERFSKLGVDISEDPMEVSPTAHYIMGGVRFDAETGQTAVKDLHVIGETTSGVHGANRLGGNSLAETVSIGKVVGSHIAEQNPVDQDTLPSEMNDIVDSHIEWQKELLNSSGELDAQTIASKIRSITEEHAGIRRSEEELRAGLKKLTSIPYEELNVNGDITGYSHEVANNIWFMRVAAKATIRSAIQRKESRGAHFREDYTEKDSSGVYNTIVKSSDGNDMQLYKSPIQEASEPIKLALNEGYELDYHHLE